MNDTAQPAENVSVENLTPDEANRIIHSHRKVRYGTACWPCRQRKVKCDNQQPCENCVKRDHTQLCSYKPNRSFANKTAKGDTVVANNRKRSTSNPDGPDDNRKAERAESWPRSLDVSPQPEDSDSAGDRYLGQNSIPALLREQSDPIEGQHDSGGIRKDMRSILGLDNSAPFPLMSQLHLHRLTRDMLHELPADREVMKLFRTYKETPQPFWGFVLDIDDFEAKLMVYLENRSRNAGTVSNSSKASAAWLAILFAVLAVGSQYHESPYHIRTSNSQKFIQIAFQFLRQANFFLRPSFDSIQAQLLITFVLLNDMKAEGSWALVGLTCRLAQSLGLHRPTVRDSNDASPEAQRKEMIRRKLWWTCVWHDTLISLSFDRSPMTNFPSCPIPVAKDPALGDFTYLETMYHLIQIISRRLSSDAVATATYDDIVSVCNAVKDLRTQACEHIRDKSKCKTALDRLQFFAIRLHTSFVISVACRPALKRDCPFDTHQKTSLSEECKYNLTETVRMFLSMHQLSVIPSRSWAFTYHSLSSALLLGILCETKADPEVRQLQGDLISALSATAARDITSPEPHVVRTDKDIELSGPLFRALTALKNIYNHGSIAKSIRAKRDGDGGTGNGTISGLESGQRTPLPSYAFGPSGATPSHTPNSDPRENAALAMAEMQNGGQAYSDFSSLPFSNSDTPNLGMDGLNASINMDSYMAPLDLYDSIWGESPDPWNPVDPLNFEFLSQPPTDQTQRYFYF